MESQEKLTLKPGGGTATPVSSGPGNVLVESDRTPSHQSLSSTWLNSLKARAGSVVAPEIFGRQPVPMSEPSDTPKGTPEPEPVDVPADLRQPEDEASLTLRDFRKQQESENPTTSETQAESVAVEPRGSWWWWGRNSTAIPPAPPLPPPEVLEEVAQVVVPDEQPMADVVSEAIPASAATEESIQDTVEQQIETQPLVPTAGQSWVSWINPVSYVSSVVNALAKPAEHSAVSEEVSEHHLSRTTSITTNDKNNTYSMWLPWTWAAGTTAPRDDRSSSLASIYSNKGSEDLAKTARKAMETMPSSNNAWGFWSRRNGASSIGELAVSGTETLNHPAKMVGEFPTTPQQKQESLLHMSDNTLSSDGEKTNRVLPSLKETYRDLTLRTRARIFCSKTIPLIKPEKHLYHRPGFVTKESTSTEKQPSKRRPKRAVVIGIHGYFPIKMVRTLIGHPTGTSVKFANMATDALRYWGEKHDVELDIETIALDGEGKIFDRVANLLTLLNNWMDLLQSADYVFFATHSQGVPVTIHIVAQLLQRGQLDRASRVGLINMAGICLGPFPGLDSKLAIRAYTKLENEIMMELFDFQDPKTYQSQQLTNSLNVLLDRNVKITFIGSIDDQLIPLHSSLCIHLQHPNIFRSIYVDHRAEYSDFIVNLLDTCLKLMNLGISDHGMIFEIGQYLGGSLANGGHSRVYNEREVYVRGIENALETTDLFHRVRSTHQEINTRQFQSNPFHLPWCIRGFFQELLKIKTQMDGYAIGKQIFEEFKKWQPESKQFKDLKFSTGIVDDMEFSELAYY